MSVRTMAKVWECSQHAGSDLLMLLAIADFSDDDGNAYPAVATLAAKCRMKERNCRYILRTLEGSGELSIKANAGPHGSNLYRVNLGSLGLQHSAGGQSLAGLQHSAATPAKDCRKPLQRIAAKPSVNHKDPSNTCAQAHPALHDEQKSKKAGATLKTFLDQCQADGVKPIPEVDPIFDYAEKVGIDQEMLAACWVEFKARFLSTNKRQKDWRAHFRNAVRRNWFSLWFLKEGEPARWTTAGEQARRAAA